MKKKKVISFTGSHGVGKSTTAGKMYTDYKINHPDKSVCLLCDMEADCRFPINSKTTTESQMWIFTNQIQKELEALYRFDVLITDRTVVDIIAYTYTAGLQDLAFAMLSLAEVHVSIYDEIYFKQINFNSFCFQDGIRDTTNSEFRSEVEKTLKEMYTQLIESDFIKGKLYYV